MIDISQEKLKTLTEAAKDLPRRRSNRPTAISTVYRWSTKGLRGHKLETILIGGVRFTSSEALERFFRSVTSGVSSPPSRRRESDTQVTDAGLVAHGLIPPPTAKGPLLKPKLKLKPKGSSK